MHFWIFTIFFLFYIEIFPTVHTQFHTLKKNDKISKQCHNCQEIKTNGKNKHWDMINIIDSRMQKANFWGTQENFK